MRNEGVVSTASVRLSRRGLTVADDERTEAKSASCAGFRLGRTGEQNAGSLRGDDFTGVCAPASPPHRKPILFGWSTVAGYRITSIGTPVCNFDSCTEPSRGKRRDGHDQLEWIDRFDEVHVKPTRQRGNSVLRSCVGGQRGCRHAPSRLIHLPNGSN